MEDFVDDFLSLEEFTVKYCIFHFIKFKTMYKIAHKNNSLFSNRIPDKYFYL